LYNILIEFNIPVKLAKLIKMCLKETYSRVWVSRHFSDVSYQNGLQQGAALLPMPFNFALEYAFQRVQVNQGGLKLNGTHQLPVYAHDVNTLGGNIHMTKKNKEALVVGSRETGLELNTKKIACDHVL
jgi:Reverse transcriptase (RNA-dependent DNA polymerase).